MQQQAKELGCDSPGDVACLCGKGDFINGLRDCSGEACGAEEQVKVLNYGSQYCAGAATSVAASISSVAESVSSLATSIASSIEASATGDDSDASATTTVTTETGVTTETSSATVTTTEGGVSFPTMFRFPTLANISSGCRRTSSNLHPLLFERHC